MKLKILIVDDVTSMRTLVKQFLRTHKEVIVIGEASDASSAMNQATELVPDIILMDISLAGISGVEVSKRIKTLLPSVRIYLFSAFELDEIRDAVLQSSADGFVQKSNIKAELSTMVEKELSIRTP